MHYIPANPHHHQYSHHDTFIALYQKHKLKQETEKVGV